MAVDVWNGFSQNLCFSQVHIAVGSRLVQMLNSRYSICCSAKVHCVKDHTSLSRQPELETTELGVHILREGAIESNLFI